MRVILASRAELTLPLTRWRSRKRRPILHAQRPLRVGSASVTLDDTGAIVPDGQQRYYPFGESRLDTASLPTDRLFTGQREVGKVGNFDIGLYHYGARFYSPKLGRFVSADTVVAYPVKPQSFNRYSYVRNNPLRYVDPTGHQDQCYGTTYFISQTTGDGGISQADCWGIQATVQAIGSTGVDAGGLWSYDVSEGGSGGNDDIGYKRLTNGSNYIYDLWSDGKEMYVFKDGDEVHDDRIDQFVNAADSYVTALDTYQDARWDAGLAFATMGVTGLVFIFGAINLGTSAKTAFAEVAVDIALLGLSAVGFGLGMARFLTSIERMNKAQQDIYDNSHWAESMYNALATDGHFAYQVP